MRRIRIVVTVAATLGLAALACAQTSPAPESVSAASAEQGATQSSRLAALVPPDMSATEACGGFKSMGECATALHAAQNVGISFKDLKTKMIRGESLDAAIRDLKPGADVRSQVSRAEQQARADLGSPRVAAPR